MRSDSLDLAGRTLAPWSGWASPFYPALDLSEAIREPKLDLACSQQVGFNWGGLVCSLRDITSCCGFRIVTWHIFKGMANAASRPILGSDRLIEPAERY